jgi:CheY-like chemotaxis protein
VKFHFFSALFMGVFAAGCFAFLFKDLSGGEIEFLIDSFYEKTHTKIWLGSQTQLNIAANASIVLFIAGDVVFDQIIQEAEEALADAQRAGIKKTKTHRMGKAIAAIQIKKKIILVDDDVDLCDIVRFAFEQHGFAVEVFNSATEALHYFAQLHDLEQNTLIILDRRLPDGDGIDVLHRIHDKFPGTIKAIFLSSVATEKEILESLKSGAMDYVTKPFSLEVLMEKASILLSK